MLLLPGSVYGHPGNHFRLGFGRRNMPEALSRLERFARERLARGSWVEPAGDCADGDAHTSPAASAVGPT